MNLKLRDWEQIREWFKRYAECFITVSCDLGRDERIREKYLGLVLHKLKGRPMRNRNLKWDKRRPIRNVFVICS